MLYLEAIQTARGRNRKGGTDT